MTHRKSPAAGVNEAETDPPLEAYSSSDEDSALSSEIQLHERNMDVGESEVFGEGLVLREFEDAGRRPVAEKNPFRDDPYGDIDYEVGVKRSSCIGHGEVIWRSRSSDEESSPVPVAALPRSHNKLDSPTLGRIQQYTPFRRMIDNTALFYVPLRLRCDVVAMCRPEVLARCPQFLHDLNADLFQCLRMLPPSVHGLVKRTKIWVNASYQYGPVDEPRTVGHSTAHHHDGWLIWARDKREKVLGIEIYSCFDYRRMRLHWNGAGLILHELCHLIHQLALPDGLENESVKRLYRAAKKSGRYDEVLRRDWAGRDCETDMAYCMVNHKEFFAEISVTYHSDSYRVLDGAPSASMEACSPPLMSPVVIERMKKKEEAQKQLSLLEANGPSPKSICLRSLSSACCDDESNGGGEISDRQQLVGRILGSGSGQFLSKLFSRQVRTPPHCNKFFPFTRGQLGVYDPDLLSGISTLWQLIENWDDDECDKGNCNRLGCLGWKGEGIENSSVWF